AAEHMGAREVDVPHVVGGVVVADLRVGPLPAFHAELVPRADHGGHRYVRMPPVVTRHRLIRHRLALINAEDYFWHGEPLSVGPDPGMRGASRVRAVRVWCSPPSGGTSGGPTVRDVGEGCSVA